MMDFLEVSQTILQDFEQEEIQYAAIGGFAMGFWGVARATVDMDFLLSSESKDAAARILQSYGYSAFYETENVGQYQNDKHKLGSIDLIFAFRDISMSMLSRSQRKEIVEGCWLPVLIPEDIIGLKVQALHNDQSRLHKDMADIEALIQSNHHAIDWDLVDSYFNLFDSGSALQGLKERLSEN